MVLSSHFIPLFAYVQALPRQPEPEPEAVHAQLQQLIGQSRDKALKDEVSLERFHQALFAVVAWVDERLARLQPWREQAAWRPYMLQRQLFNTSLAGVQFFDRLESIDATDHELREVFLTCLGLGFVGKFSQTPNAPALEQLKQEQYALVRGEQLFTGSTEGSPLFTPAYRTVSGAKVGGKWRLGKGARVALVILVPLAFLASIALWFDHLLVQSVSEIAARLP